MRKNKAKFQFILILFILIPICSLIKSNIDNDRNSENTESNYEKYSLPYTSSASLKICYFNYYKEITIDPSKVEEDLTNFPLLISIIDSDLHTEVQDDGDDIAFHNGSNWLDHEIELFQKDFNGTHARLIAWVKVPSLSSTSDTKIYMYYGNSTMEAQEKPTEVWTSNYKAVWHLNTTLLDSTANNNDGTNSVPGPDDVSAFIARGRDYDDTASDYSNMGKQSSINNLFNGGATISAWIYPESYGGGNYGRIIDKASATDGSNGWSMCVDGVPSPSKHLLFFRGFSDNRGLWYTPQDSIPTNQWSYVVVTYNDDSASYDPKIYINGIEQSIVEDLYATPEGTASDDTAQTLLIGNHLSTLTRGFCGFIDEVRLLKERKLSGWILTEYRNQNDPESFYTVSSSIEVEKIPPDITIKLPIDNNLFSAIAPEFNVEINDSSSIDSMWYRLHNGTVTTINTIFKANETINQTRWNEMGNGTVTIQFFANDSCGNEGFSEVIVRKDIKPPSIIIHSPNYFDLYGSPPPTYNVEIWDPNGVNTTWYTLNNGIDIPFTGNGTISQSAWNLCGNGTVSIKFYANDSLGNEGFSEVTVRKEIESPNITIFSPHNYDLFGKIAPNFTVEIWDNNGVNTTWYTLNNGINTPFTENGTISQSAWNFWGNGTVSIKFYANNSLGNTDFEEIIVWKDVIDPVIVIYSPDPDDLFGRNAPSYNVIITDPNGVDTKWYTIDGGITNTTFTANGIINQGLWELRGNGTVAIRFYANDSLSNEGYSEVIVRKDIEPPLMQILYPTPDELFGAIAPNFNIEIIDSSGIDPTKWYSINDGINITFISNGTINQPLWNLEENGTVTIKFYARDLLGNEGFSEVIVRKDIEPPSIQINTPHDDDIFNELAPTFEVEIWDINGINMTWYTLNNGIDIPFTGNGTISQSAWDICDYGAVSIKFYANDSLGNEDFSGVVVQKELNPPSIEIYNPITDQLFGETPPAFNVKITDLNGIDTMWYSLDGGLTNTTFTINGSINQAIWDTFGDESITIRFYANNSLGIIGFSEVSILKDIYAPMIMINTPNNNSYCNKAPIINIDADDINLDKLWCKIGSSDILLINGGDFQLNTSIWNSLAEGSFQIFIYANDTSGHLNDTFILNLCKDTVNPNEPIISDPPIGDVSLPIIFDWEEVTDASGIAYYRLIIDTEDNPFMTPGFVFEINISSTSSYYELLEYLAPRNYNFFIYAIDNAGNQGDPASGPFTIISVSAAPSEFPWWIILVIAVPLGLAIVLVSLKKSKKKNIQVVVIDKELDKLKQKRAELDIEAKSAMKAYNYPKAAEIYEECGKISFSLYQEGDKLEQYRYKNFKGLELEARSKAEAIPLRNACINKVLTKFFDENEIKYYSDPQIYPDSQETINGIILNDNRFLEHRLTNFEDGSDLADELKINPKNMENINAIQILYTKNLNEDAIVESCKKYQNPEMMLFIVGVEWLAYHYDDTLTLPQDKNINYPENIKVINLNLFSRIFQITNEYQKELNKIMELKDDLEVLKKLYESRKITLHDTTELKEELKQKGWFFLI